MTEQVEALSPLRSARRPRRTVTGAGLLALLLAGGAAAFWLTHPDAFPGNGVGAAFAGETRVRMDQPLLVGFQDFPEQGEVIELQEVLPLLDGASADIRLALCTPPYPRGTILGSESGTLEDVCTEVLSVEGGDYQHPSGTETVRQLVLEITPRSSGAVIVNGLRVRYRDGIRRGTATLGPRIKVDVTER